MSRLFTLRRIACSAVLLSSISSGFAQRTDDAPLMRLLDRFTASSVPALAPTETECPHRKPVENPHPPGMPGKGLAEHPMLYLGEGYKKLFVIAGGMPMPS